MKPGALFMSVSSCVTFLFLIFACGSGSDTELKQSAEATFRISLNSYQVLTDAERDSIENSKPWYCGHYAKNKFYDLLVQKGIASTDGLLDTSSLDFHFLDFEKPRSHISLSGIDFNLDTDDLTGLQNLEVKTSTKKSTIEFKQPLVERWVSVNDVDGDGKKSVIILEKYYVMGGYNFDLKLYDL